MKEQCEKKIVQQIAYMIYIFIAYYVRKFWNISTREGIILNKKVAFHVSKTLFTGQN